LYQTIILQKKKGYMNIYGHILCIRKCLYIYSINNFLPGSILLIVLPYKLIKILLCARVCVCVCKCMRARTYLIHSHICRYDYILLLILLPLIIII